jgi:hypothetical protein
VHQPDFAGWQAHLAVDPLFGQKLGRNTRRPRKLAALARQQLDVVDLRPDRDIADVQRSSASSPLAIRSPTLTPSGAMI